MSNFRAIATVTATLQRALQSAVQGDIPGATVSTLRPSEGAGAGLPATGVNIFLYQVTQNPHRANADLPTRRAAGDIMQRPQAALCLHYLLSFYGDEAKLEPQRLLGSALALLHSQPLLTRAQIAAAVADQALVFLKDSDLADQPDLVRFAMLPMTLDELSRLWSVLLQTHYVLSMAFEASVVLIERQLTPQSAQRIRAIGLAAVPMQHPFIRRVTSAAGEDAPILAGATLMIAGADLLGESTSVEIDSQPVLAASISADSVTLTLPPGIAAGPHALQVKQSIKIGTPATPRPGFSSNLASFVLQPQITKTLGADDITITNVQGAGPAPRSATITIKASPDIGAKQTAMLEMLVQRQVAFAFPAAARNASSDTLVFAVKNVPAGDYVIRIRVDGADSPLQLDANRIPLSPKGAIA